MLNNKNYSVPKFLKISNSLAQRFVIFCTFFVIIVILFGDNIFKHGGFVNKIKQFSHQIISDENDFSVSVKNYLDNYFRQMIVSEEDVLKLAEHDTNIPTKYIKEWNKNYSHSNWNLLGSTTKWCDVRPPPIQSIHMNNIYWQSIVESEELNLFSYNAYYDERETTNKIRIIGISDHYNQLINQSLWCLLYFENQRKSLLTEITEINELAYNFGNFYKRKGYYLPVLLTCDIPEEVENSVPKAVAIKTDANCSQQLFNILRVIYNKPKHDIIERFGVCVRGLYYYSNDFSLRLLEWLEFVKILGAHKVFLYSFSIHPNMEKVIDYYQRKDFVDLKHSTHVGNQLNHKYLDEIFIKRKGNFLLPQETLELNDCLYKNLYKYEYLVLIDIDEIIAPVNAYNWHDMVTQIHNHSIIRPDKKQFGSYLFSETRFYNELITQEINSNDLSFTMSHLHRGNFTNKAPKGFHITKNIKVIWNHAAIKCINKDNGEDCALHWVKKDIGYLQHYRPGIDRPQNCSSEDLKSCAVFDTILLKYNNILQTNMKIALNEIFHSNNNNYIFKH